MEERLLASQKEPVLCKLQPLQPLQPALAVSPHALGFALSLLGRAGLGESYAVTGAGLVTIMVHVSAWINMVNSTFKSSTSSEVTSRMDSLA